MIHYFYGTLQVGIGQTLCSFEHVSCFDQIHNILYFFAAMPNGVNGIQGMLTHPNGTQIVLT